MFPQSQRVMALTRPIVILHSSTSSRSASAADMACNHEPVVAVGCVVNSQLESQSIFIESIEKIIEPEAPDYSAPTIIVVIASIALKSLLAYYLRQTGHKVKSSVLTASAAETLNDTWISVAVLASAIIYIIWHVDIEAYVSIIISVIIIKIGLEFIFPNLSHHHHHPLETDSTHGVHHKS